MKFHKGFKRKEQLDTKLCKCLQLVPTPASTLFTSWVVAPSRRGCLEESLGPTAPPGALLAGSWDAWPHCGWAQPFPPNA